MKYKTAFRLGLKLIGVYLIAISVMPFIVKMSQFYVATRSQQSMGIMDVSVLQWTLVLLDSQLLNIVVGLYLFFKGEWIVNKAIPSNRPYCHECGYELTNATLNICPECGTEFKAHSPQRTNAESSSEHQM
ncbi:MAG: hypothetical protein ACF8OB_15600 [Phycisphaeraceae bacterium JB051]